MDCFVASLLAMTESQYVELSEQYPVHPLRWFVYHRTMKAGPDIAMVASLVGDPARANMLTALMTGRALTASELAHQAGISRRPRVRIWRSSKPAA